MSTRTSTGGQYRPYYPRLEGHRRSQALPHRRGARPLAARIAARPRRRAEGGQGRGLGSGSLARRSVALVFEKPSTRTRVSFEVGVAELGGTPLVLRGDELQLSRGESLGDTGRILSRYTHAIAVRAGAHEPLAELAETATVPVINMLTPLHHPCQALADLLTLRERFDRSRVFASPTSATATTSPAPWRSWAGPPGSRSWSPAPTATGWRRAWPSWSTTPQAVAGADAVYTDVWVSMGDEAEAERRRSDLAPYQLNEDLLALASADADSPPLPPRPSRRGDHRGVLYGERSAVWDQAENRLHAQKALLEFLLA